MFLKSLTLKGFKSFADPTVIELQPGVTVVVGPNGSGKSNVVDAVAWVLGAQGPRVVRSSRMDDVIFAGTSKRPALGRAEVALTIDNRAGKLPIDFSEVTVTRTLFRTGESEYAINGVACRLLDVQELFSDTGVGRQQHVIISQGRLDEVLGARPEERRMVVEEAAGVLKYRRRKERAERRLEASEASLSRLQDLQRELRRQLRPLERQAASALRHEELSGEVRALRLYLAGRELAALADRLQRTERDSAAVEAADRELEDELAALDARLAEAEASLGEERSEALEPLLGAAERLLERTEGLTSICRERRRAGAELFAALADVEELAALEAERARVGEDLERCDAEATALVPEWEQLAEAEAELASRESVDEERFGTPDATGVLAAHAELRREHAAKRDALAKLSESEVRSSERLAALARRRQSAEERLGRARSSLSVLSPALEEAEAFEHHAAERLRRAEAAAATCAAERQSAEEELHAARARAEALGMALDEARARAGLERLADLPGVLGTLLDVVEVDEALSAAFEAAAAGALDAVLVEAGEPVRAALARLRAGGQGGALLPVPGDGTPAQHDGTPAQHDGAPAQRDGALAQHPASLPALPGTEPLLARVRASEPGVRHLLERLLAGVLVADGPLDEALELAIAHPERTIVTPAGDRLAPQGWRLSSGASGVTKAAHQAALQRAERAGTLAVQAASTATAATAELEEARAAATEALRRLDRLAAELQRSEQDAAAAEAELASADEESRALEASRAEAAGAAATAAEVLAGLEAQLAAAQEREERTAQRAGEAQAARREREERGRALAALRRDLEVRAAALEERRSLLGQREAELARRLAERQEERIRAEGRRAAYEREDVAIVRLAERLEGCRTRLAGALARLHQEQGRRSEQARVRLEAVAGVRHQREARERQLTAGRQRLQRLELERTEARVRQEAALESLARDLEALPEEALGAPRPELPDDADPAERLRQLERELRLLGPVNPLAREELAAVAERSAFVDTQLEDVRAARRELGQIIQAVDDEIVEVFTAAFADVEQHFETLVQTLFPGGNGRLVLTAPDDPLDTGIEIEARPAGRNVRRLSLLSGGERSMVALAFLFAVFRARPSPFYLLDEVEAALDEVNLRRFLSLLEEFRDEAQLIVVSHQKRTMEVADALYGVTMQPGGASKIVSEQLRPAASVP